MIEILTNLYIGNQDDYERNVKLQAGWAIVHACKEPYHRQALGYKGRAVDKNHPEYLIARRGNRLILNLVDVDNPEYISKEILDTALDFINENLTKNSKVLVHCNQGQSRSASIGLLYLVKFTDIIKSADFIEAEKEYLDLYPSYNPANGIRTFMLRNWNNYRNKVK